MLFNYKLLLTNYFVVSSLRGSSGFFFFYMAARTVQRHDQFRAVEHCMLKILVERDGIVRAGIHRVGRTCTNRGRIRT